MSNTTKLSSQGNKLTKFCAACMENLANTQELPKQKLLLGKIIILQKGAIDQGVGHVM